jgi:hypothetical protein
MLKVFCPVSVRDDTSGCSLGTASRVMPVPPESAGRDARGGRAVATTGSPEAQAALAALLGLSE